MPSCHTTHFGKLDYDSAATIEFAEGLPGFESENRFVVVQQTAYNPLVFLQSLEAPDLCFPAMPVRVVDPAYKPQMSAADLELLGFVSQPVVGEDAIILALVAVHQEDPTANLLAPIVINLRNRTAAQCIDPAGRYSHRHALAEALEPAS
jgi:flagellar assembly factor FliW